MYDFTLALSPQLTLAYHTQGEVIYWRYLDLLPPRSREIAETFSAVSGYAAEETPFASGFAGYKDWFIQNFDRPGYQALKSAMLRSGDTLVVKSLDRLSRSKADIHSELQWFKQNNIHLKVIDLPTTMMDLPPGQEWVFEMVNNILIEVLGTIAEQERLTIRQRQREGINAAKAKGKHLGRPVTSLPDNWEEVLALWQAGKITAREAMRRTGMKRTTFYQLVRKSS